MRRRYLIAALCLAAIIAPPAAAMEMRVEGNRMILSGMVDGQTANAVMMTLAGNRAIDTVVLRNSGGGAAGAMIALADALRERRVTTMVDGRCLSACAMIFMGGVRRTIAPGADARRTFVGFHGVQQPHQPARDWDQAMVSAIRRFSGGRVSPALALDMVSLPRAGYAAFWHPRHFRRADGASVAWCVGGEANRPEGCRGRGGIDGLRAGIFTQ